MTTKNESLQKLIIGLEEILKDSFELCKSENKEISLAANKINKKAHELKKITTIYRDGGYLE